MRRRDPLTLCALALITLPTAAQQLAPLALNIREEPPSEAVSAEGLIRLDTSVTDPAGKPVAALQRSDFTLLDNGQPQPIVAFRASNATNPDDSLSVILLLDTLHLSPDIAASARQQVVQFLEQNAGKLAQPVSLYSLDNSGFFLVANPSTDGTALAAALAANRNLQAFFLAPSSHSPLKADVEFSMQTFPALAGLHALWTIAAAQTSRPGRKLLLWIGPAPGVPGTTGAYVPDSEGQLQPLTDSEPAGQFPSGKKLDARKQDLFRKIRWFSLLLRQARVTLDCLSLSDRDQPTYAPWTKVLPAVSPPDDAAWMNLSKNVLAIHSGGRVLSSSHGLVDPMNASIANASVFFSLTFDPPLAQHPDEYHSLQIALRPPTLTAATLSGYYDQPFYDDPPNPALQPTTVAQLEQLLHTTHGGAAVHQLSHLILTERLTQARLQSLLADAHNKHLLQPLELLADQSTFLDLPPAQLSPDPPPTLAEQQRLLQSAAAYLDRVIPTLPEFFAVRTSVFYYEISAYPGLPTLSEPLHAQPPVIENVLDRQGKEVVRGASSHAPLKPPSLNSYGTFGPILTLLQFVSKSPGNVTWVGWEPTPTGRRAVFRYRLAATPLLTLRGCCYPNGGSNARTGIASDSHGEFALDPATGAILRLQTQSVLTGFVPTDRADVMVSYGPVDIGGRTYVVPLRSVNIWRARSVANLIQWHDGFGTWGPYETKMNVFNFSQHHIFRARSHILPGFQLVPSSNSPTPP